MSRNVTLIIAVVAALLAFPFVARLVRPAGAAPAQNQSATSVSTAPFPAGPAGTPAIVAAEPANGATGILPSLKEIRVTFDTPMGGGFSWTGGGTSFPGASGTKPYWTPDRRTCVLPVDLRPNSAYKLGLNSPSHKNFKSESGVPLMPVVWTFSTGS